jgi:transcriptional regulator with XRE-family HTH domain
MTFGETLRHIRTDKGLSQREVARRIPMDYSRFSRLENDRLGFNPTHETIEKIVRALEASQEERRELLAAAGRLDKEIESLARIASERPAVGRLLRVVVDLPPDKVEALLSYVEANFLGHPKSSGAMVDGTFPAKRKAKVLRRKGRE